MYNYFASEHLLEPPVKRAAFSDRTAYLMAEMSRLAYFKFEGGNNLDEIMKVVSEIVHDKEKCKKLERLITAVAVANGAEEAEQILANILREKGFELIKTFNSEASDCQAFLCRKPDQGMAVLAFRGTEMKGDLKDVKTDVRARLETVQHNGQTVRIHSGYYRQFVSLKEEIEAALSAEELQGDQLFITGHSLGGALAVTATKFLASDRTGACYTFGSPPVGTKQFDVDIKTPIYRIIHHVDIVPRLPNPNLILILRGIGLLLELLLSPFAGVYGKIKSAQWYQKLELLILDAKEYRQSGYGCYLVGSLANPRLRYSISSFDELMWWLAQLKNIFRGEMKLLSDHSIQRYSKMLRKWAETRLGNG